MTTRHSRRSSQKSSLGRGTRPRTPAAKRQVTVYLQASLPVSQRRACRLLGLQRSTCRLVSRRKEDPVLLARLKQLAAERPRFGYRRLSALLRREGTLVNAKKVYRLCTKEGLLVRPKKRKPRLRPSEKPEAPALEHPNQLWSLDFVEDALADGRQLRTLTIVDVYSRECPHIEVDTSLPGLRVVRVLESLAAQRQLPERLLVDNGPEFVCRTLAEWAERRGVKVAFTRPGKPTDKPHIESFNGRFRDECLNVHYFLSVPDAKWIINAWRFDYNHNRPHSALGGATPIEFLHQVATVQAPLSPDRPQPVR